MKNPPVILSRSLCAVRIQIAGAAGSRELRVLSALPRGQDGRIARLHLMDLPEGLTLHPAPSGEVLWTRVIDGAPVADMLRAADGSVALPVAGVTARVPVTPDECAILAGRDVILGHMNAEPVAVLRDWLSWHRTHHGATGALVVTRGRAGEAEATADALRRLLRDRPEDAAALAGMVVLLVDCDQPLGLPDRPHETHLLNAPDAPGKDRLATEDPDPWHSPLGFGPLFDLLRQRFLAHASGVASLEVIDLVAEARQTMFDEARATSQGLIPLRGSHAYPWSLRKNLPARFGDHICTRFDAPSHCWRWCLVPERIPEGAIWMRDRILGASGPARAISFHRCMALRHGRDRAVGIGQMVPKTSLVEDPVLVARAEALDVPALRPPQTPAPAPRDASDPGSDKSGAGNRVLIVTTMKNEGPFILEWLAYHRAMGVTDFLIYTNDCTDGTDAFLQLLARKGLCQWRDNPYRQSGMKPQHAALDAANDEPVLAGADWAICMDVDEFIAVHVGDGTLAALFAAMGEANMISLTWRLFGNADIDGYRDGFITQNHTLCAREFTNKPHQAWGFKTLYRNLGLFRKMGVHRPKGMLPAAVDHLNWVNGSGRPMPRREWRTAWRSHSGTYGYDLVSLNHYAVRSAESFLVKRDRGRVNHVDRDQGLAYWFRMNHNVVEDKRMHRALPRLQAEYDRLMADPEIRAAHEGCVAAHRARIAALKAQPRYRDFHAALTSQRMRKLSRLHGHFGANVYLSGPEVVPDEIVARDPEDAFFFTVDLVGETQH